ncbi:MAG: four helix bundle protein [Endomicrobia bacterium]|nr:four helix bundle protein [Endomicrobiia bacterium]
MKTHKDLDIWIESIELVKEIYAICSLFPKEEKYNLAAQIKHSAVSIPSNIAEGAARSSKREFIHFLYISLGSLAELETQLIIARQLNFLNNDNIFSEIEKNRRKILNFIKYLKNKK